MEPSIAVLVRDDATGAFIGAGATLVQRDGAFVDSVSFPADAPTYNTVPLATHDALERAGEYTITVRRAGFADWERTGIVVSDGRCNVRTVHLTAFLTPASAAAAPATR
jgi:hypothetical protein